MSEAADARQRALAYIAQHNTVSLATQGDNGLWASTVFYASVDFTLYFLSEPKTLHVQNAYIHPLIAATINEDYHDWRQIKGIQISGRCEELVQAAEIEAGLAVYVEKYPFVKQFLAPGYLLEQVRVEGRELDVRLFRVSPSRLFFIDNERGFSNRQEIAIGPQA